MNMMTTKMMTKKVTKNYQDTDKVVAEVGVETIVTTRPKQLGVVGNTMLTIQVSMQKKTRNCATQTKQQEAWSFDN